MTKGQKIFLGASLAGLLLGVPLLIWAQGTAECCRLSQDITVNDFTFGCHNIAGGHEVSGATFCNAPGANHDCEFVSGNVTFAKNTIIGAGDCVGNTENKCTLKGVEETIEIESQEWGTVCLLNSIYNVTNWIFFFFLAIAILIGVIAGYYFMTSAGDETKLGKARSMLTYMAIGLIVAALAKVIPTLVRTVVGV